MTLFRALRPIAFALLLCLGPTACDSPLDLDTKRTDTPVTPPGPADSTRTIEMSVTGRTVTVFHADTLVMSTWEHRVDFERVTMDTARARTPFAIDCRWLPQTVIGKQPSVQIEELRLRVDSLAPADTVQLSNDPATGCGVYIRLRFGSTIVENNGPTGWHWGSLTSRYKPGPGPNLTFVLSLTFPLSGRQGLLVGNFSVDR